MMIPFCKSKLALVSRTLTIGLILSSSAAFSQSWFPQLIDPRLELMGAYWKRVEFDRLKDDYRFNQREERRRVPIYNARLNAVVVAFHTHISKDNHYLDTNCSICRKHLGEIKSYSKKIQNAMK